MDLKIHIIAARCDKKIHFIPKNSSDIAQAATEIMDPKDFQNADPKAILRELTGLLAEAHPDIDWDEYFKIDPPTPADDDQDPISTEQFDHWSQHEQ